jgi:uncharacterized protein YjbI with pentapeptide repeats
MRSPSPLPPSPALVRPRAVSPDSGEVLPLETLAAELLWRGDVRAIEIAGGPGGGKTTALRHLEAVLPSPPTTVFLDEPSLLDFHRQAIEQTVVFASREIDAGQVVLKLAPWTDDDLIELLLAVAPQRCGDVMTRVRAAEDRHLLAGNPALWRMAIDQLLADSSLTTLRAAVVAALSKKFMDAKERRLAGEFSLAILLGHDATALRLIQMLCPNLANYGRFGPLRHPLVQRLLAGQKVATLLRSGGNCPFFERPLPQALIEELAIWVNSDPAVGERLHAILSSRRRSDHAEAASVLFAADPRWRPAEGQAATLGRGRFPKAQWAGLRLFSGITTPSMLARANLTGANLAQSFLDGAYLVEAQLAGARLDKASLAHANARGVDLSDANLTAVRAPGILLTQADLRRARCDDATLSGADLEQADLRAASFRNANLTGAVLSRCQVEDADFTGANFRCANLRHVALRQARLDGASFWQADLAECDLEGVALHEARFLEAWLKSCYFTGSHMPRANFQGADLRGAGLADIDWERADLRGADLRGCSFHMGSSRSGLVGSPYPGHGSKTGFYTDDYHDQDFKAPEEIRKANLCGADLRGAKLDGVDFYLVDLRGAKFDAGTREHLARCGAILFDRCA